VRLVSRTGEFGNYGIDYGGSYAVRPALNRKSEILVSDWTLV